ncbi:MAG: hypothetical protein KJO07_13915 [Deltaproteobacteria bacterium]|nr:hypothetical protein [Deltaproteobacteria bacterium]
MEFRAGQVLGRTFSVFGKNIVSLGLLAGIFIGPFFIPAVSEYFGGHVWQFLLCLTLALFALQATVVYVVFQQLRGDHAGLFRALKVGLSRLLPVTGTILLLYLALIGAALPGAVLGFATRSPIVQLLGQNIPMLIVMMMFYVAVPVSVVERPGVMMSLKRSQELTEGHRWGIFGIFLVTVMLGVVILMLLVNAANSGSISFTVYLVAVLVVMISAALLYSVGVAVTYHDLRLEKDGVSVDELASVFE